MDRILATPSERPENRCKSESTIPCWAGNVWFPIMSRTSVSQPQLSGQAILAAVRLGWHAEPSTATKKARYILRGAGRARHSVRAVGKVICRTRRARSDAPYHVAHSVCRIARKLPPPFLAAQWGHEPLQRAAVRPADRTALVGTAGQRHDGTLQGMGERIRAQLGKPGNLRRIRSTKVFTCPVRMNISHSHEAMSARSPRVGTSRVPLD